jgi:predicted permease
MFLGYFAGARRIIENHHVASLNVLEARGKAAGSSPHPIAIALALGMSGEIAREAILLTAIPTGFFGILFGLNYGVRSQAIGSTLALSSLVSVITLTAAILLTSQMK